MKKEKGNIRRIKKSVPGWILIFPALFLVYFLVIRTQALCIAYSFAEMKGFRITGFAGVDNYIRVVKDSLFLKLLGNTFMYTLWSILIGYFVPIVLAIALNEMVHFRSGFRVITYFPSALPGVAVMMLWYFMYYPDASGLFNVILNKMGFPSYGWLQDVRWTIPFIVLSMTWQGAGATTLYYFAALQGVSRELYEAAMIDGAGFLRRIRTVALPHISVISLLFLVRQILAVFTVMEQPLQMTDGGPNNASMSLGLQTYKYAFVQNRPQLAMALSVIMFLILCIATVFYFKMEKKLSENM
ncbi:MAG: sugar ABC transporter permease [Firmicutes bacterium]|nr:sugar ABC transporter permease [Bacillota bacterium]